MKGIGEISYQSCETCFTFMNSLSRWYQESQDARSPQMERPGLSCHPHPEESLYATKSSQKPSTSPAPSLSLSGADNPGSRYPSLSHHTPRSNFIRN